MSRGHNAAAVAVASGFYRQDKVRGLSRMATTLWDSPCNGLAHREVAVNDEDHGATPSMAIRVMAPDVDVPPSGADYLARPWRRYVFPVLRYTDHLFSNPHFRSRPYNCIRDMPSCL